MKTGPMPGAIFPRASKAWASPIIEHMDIELLEAISDQKTNPFKENMRTKSHYEVLGLGENATMEQITKRYRYLALKHYSKDSASERFRELNAAYEALALGNFSEYQDPLITLRKCFGYSNPLEPLFDFERPDSNKNFNITSCPPDFEKQIHVPAAKPLEKTPKKNPEGATIEYKLNVTLEQIATGCKKIIRIVRDVLRFGSVTQETKYIELNVRPGWETGTRIIYTDEGHQRDDGLGRGDVTFLLNVLPHERFIREGQNIKYTCSIPLKLALGGGMVEIPTLSGQTVLHSLNRNIVNTKTVHVIKGKGLPFPSEPSVKGDIIVDFKIIFPEEVNPRLKKEILEILPN